MRSPTPPPSALHRIALGFLLAGIATMIPSAAAATGLRIGTEVSWVRDTSYDVFSEDDVLAEIDVGLSYTVARPGIFLLDLELGYRYLGSAEAVVAFADLTSDLTGHEAYAGVRGAIDPGLTWLRPYARLQTGALFGIASFRDRAAAGWTLEDWAPAAVVYAGAGIEILFPPTVFSAEPPDLLTESFSMGLYVEGGYSYRSALAFSPMRPDPEDPDVAADLIPADGFAAGDLSLSGGDLRAGFVARF